MNIAKTIKDRRTFLDLRQIELSKKAGVTQGFISKIESGSCDVRVDILLKIFKALRLSIEVKEK